jgi:UDP-N-acetylmuramate dehydrogenase
LIEQAGFSRGFGDGAARVSTKHTLALTNRGSATTADLLELARTIRAGVARAYGITLEPEPVLVGCGL